MFKKYYLVILFIVTACLVSCKINEAPKAGGLPAEYIITHGQGVTDEQLNMIFKNVQPFSIKRASKNITVLYFVNDPGLQILKENIGSSSIINSVQPNYHYQKLQ